MSVLDRLEVGRPVRTGANLTPMIDVTFLLVIFFILVSRITSVEQVPLELPDPTDPVSQPPSESPRLVVNLVGDGTSVPVAIFDQVEYPLSTSGLDAINDALTARLRAIPDLQVNLRADRRIPYRHVDAIMLEVAEAGGRAGRPEGVRVNLVVTAERSATEDQE